MGRRKVVLDHDGGLDDLVALCVLLANPHKVDLLGCVVIGADCFVEDGAEASARILATVRCAEATACTALQPQRDRIIPVGLSTLEAVNAFPTEWRRLATNLKFYPSLNTPGAAAWKDHVVKESGQQLLADLVMNAGAVDDKVTIVVTGPLSNVAWCVNKYGEAFTDKVEKVVLMGGAVDVKGNVAPKDCGANVGFDADGSQEWNIFWDAPSAQTVFRCDALTKVVFSLDATNHVPITGDFVRRFGAGNSSVLSQFVGSAYALTTHWIEIYNRHYYAWDVLTVAWLLNDELATEGDDPIVARLEAARVDVIVPSDMGTAADGVRQRLNEGQTVRLQDGNPATTLIAVSPDPEKFYSFVTRCCLYV